MFHLLSPTFCDDMYELAYQMITPNLYKRYDIIKVNTEYIKILKRHFFNSVININSIIKSHDIIQPFNDQKKGGNKSGRHYLKINTDTPITLNNSTNKNSSKIFDHITRKNNSPFKIFNIKMHSIISKKRSKKYRFFKNKKRHNKPPTLLPRA
jgi:hypothetical protein